MPKYTIDASAVRRRLQKSFTAEMQAIVAHAGVNLTRRQLCQGAGDDLQRLADQDRSRWNDRSSIADCGISIAPHRATR